MSKKEKLFRRMGIMSAFFMLLSSLTLISLLVLDLLEFNLLLNEEPRTYWVQFESEDEIILDRKYTRGEKIEKPKNPTHSPDEYYSYTFRGWDINGDRTPDAIPGHAFYDFLAIAIFQKKQIKPLPSSSSDSNSENGSGSNSAPASQPSSGGSING